MLRLTLLVLLLSLPASAQKPVAPASAPTVSAELQALLAETDTIAAAVSALRGLPLKRKIARGVASREEVTRLILADIDRDYPAAEILAESRVLVALGLLPPGTDYKALMVDVLTEQIAGFYDPRRRELHIADWIDPGVQRVVLVHEIDHALQDQSFDLRRFVKPNKNNGDEVLARQALVEGDGAAVMVEYLFRASGERGDPWATDAVVNLFAEASTSTPGSEKLEAAPLVVRESLLFPYLGGIRFIARARRLHAWSAIDAYYGRPPASTEQILHPEKYEAGERPVAIKAAALPALKGWKKIHDNVLGELTFSLLLREHGVAREVAERAAAGWGGDRLAAFAPPKDDGAQPLVVIDLSAWDAEVDAIEARDALVLALAGLCGQPAAEAGALVSCAAADGRLVQVERQGARVLLLVGVAAAEADAVRREAWKRWR